MEFVFSTNCSYFALLHRRATFGCDNAGPNICVICEYDALPDIGHACGHNLIAECGAAAGIGIKAALEASGNKYGKVRKRADVILLS